jgi:hypothetical protein
MASSSCAQLMRIEGRNRCAHRCRYMQVLSIVFGFASKYPYHGDAYNSLVQMFGERPVLCQTAAPRVAQSYRCSRRQAMPRLAHPPRRAS